MKKRFKILYFLYLICFEIFNLYALDNGSSGANFLKIPVAVIPAGLSESYTSMIGPDSILYNPSGIGLLSYNSISISHNQYLLNMNQEYISIAMPTKYGSFGAVYTTLNSGDIKSYDENESLIGKTKTSHKIYGISYAKSWPYFEKDKKKLDPMLITPSWTKIPLVTDYRPKVYRFSVGFTAKTISEELDDIISKTNMLDIGCLLVLPNHWQIGASASNLGGKQKFYLQEDKVPIVYRLGIAKDFHTVKDLMVFTFMSDIVKYEDDKAILNIGMETDILKSFQLRFGYKNNKDIGSKISMGFGMNFDRLTSDESFFKGIRMDYAFIDYGDLGGTHRFGVQLIW